MSLFLIFCALLLACFAIASASPYKRWIPIDDVVDQRRMEVAAYGMVALAVMLAWCGGRLW